MRLVFSLVMKIAAFFSEILAAPLRFRKIFWKNLLKRA